MPLGNPIQKQNNTRIVSATATAGQVQFTITGGYTINAISVYRNGVRLSNADDFTASDGSTVSLNVAADVGDSLDFHIFDKFTVSNAIVSAASTQSINGNLNVTGSLYATTFRPDDIVTAGNANLGSLNVSGISTLGIATVSALGLDLTGTANVTGVSTFNSAATFKDDVTLTGSSYNAVWDKSDSALEFGDNAKIKVGSNSDLNIYHDGNSYISNAVANQLAIQSDDLKLRSYTGTEKYLTATVNGAVILYHDDSTRLTTTNTGVDIGSNINVAGIATVAGDVSIADKIIHTGDTNTAIRFPAADTVSFETGGSERVRIGSTGLVGIGTNTNWSIYDLQVKSGIGIAEGTTGHQSLSLTNNSIQSLVIGSSYTNLFLNAEGGDVGIGTDSIGTNHKLAVCGDAGEYAVVQIKSGSLGHGASVEFGDSADDDYGEIMQFSSSAGGTYTGRMRFKAGGTDTMSLAGGRVLIGTPSNTSPIGWGNNLQVAATSAAAGVSIRRDSADTGGALLVFGKTRGSLNGSTVVQDGDQIGGMYFAGGDGTDVNSIAAQISVEVDGSPGSNDMPGRILFKTTTDGAASPTERMRIMQGGQVSIGNNPTVHTDTIFHIEDSGETNIKIEGSTSTLGARISLQNNDTTANAYSQYAFNDAGGQSTSAIQGINTDQTNNYGEIAFLTRNAQGSPPTERVRIDKDGNVLIGETTTSYPVDIGYANNTVYATNAVIGNAVEIHNKSTTAGTAAGIHMYVTGNGANAAAVHLNCVHTANGSGTFTVGTRHSAGSHIERFRIQADGKVTINDDSYAATSWLDLRANDPNTKEILTICGQRNSNRGVKIGTMIPSTGNQNDAAVCYNAQDEEGSPKGYHAQHQFQIAGDTAMTIGYQGLHRVGIGISGPGAAVHATAADMVGYFHLNSTGDHTAIVMRHNRGGLSGYSGTMIAFRGNDNTQEGSIVIGTTATAFNTSSDYRLKENIVGLSGGVVRVKQLKPYRFNFKKTSDVTVDGFLAHEVSSVIPEAVTGTKDEVHTEDVIEGDEVVRKKGDIKPQQLDYAKLTPLLTAALQEVIVRVESLETENTALKARVAALESS